MTFFAGHKHGTNCIAYLLKGLPAVVKVPVVSVTQSENHRRNVKRNNYAPRRENKIKYVKRHVDCGFIKI
jgi:hypothetical protein